MIKPFYQDTQITEYHGHTPDILKELPAESVHMVVTSVPYWGLRDYGLEPQVWPCGCEVDHSEGCEHRWGDEKTTYRTAYESKRKWQHVADECESIEDMYLSSPGTSRRNVGQGQFCQKCNAYRGSLGLEPTPELYIQHVVEVFREIWRVGRPDFTVWLNIGDSYTSTAQGTVNTIDNYVGKGTGGARANYRPITGLKPKDLCLIPSRVAKALQEPYYIGKIKKEQDRIWLAAIIDGEGSIFLHRQPKGTITGRGRKSFRSQDNFCAGIAISNCSESLVRRASELFGNDSFQHTSETGNRRDHYQSRITGNLAKGILKEIYAYLVAKQHEARLVIGCPPSGEKARQYWESVKELHKKGHTEIDCDSPNQSDLWEPGWWLRRDIIWNKPNPMPESCNDRPTSSHEYVFLLTKSGTPQFWTHRDHAGTRSKPKADWRWVNQITEDEVSIAPPDWKEIIICPNCEGKGRALVDLSYECLGIWTEYFAEDECPVCEGKKKVQKWKRINLWKGHDYFYDADAVREAHQTKNLEYEMQKKSKWGHKKKLTCKPNVDNYIKGNTHSYHPAGRNLRSVWTIATEPTPEAHFATFPSKLCEIAIKAGTSEKGCCSNCGSPYVRVRSIDKCGAPCYSDKHGNKNMQSMPEDKINGPVSPTKPEDMQSMCSGKKKVGLVDKQGTTISKSENLSRYPQEEDSEKSHEIPQNQERQTCNADRVQEISANRERQRSCEKEGKDICKNGEGQTSRPDSMQQKKGLVDGSEREFHRTRLDRHSKGTTEQMPLLQRTIQPENVTNDRPCNSIDQNRESRKEQHSSSVSSVQFKKMESLWRPSCKCQVNKPIPCTVLDPFSGSGRALIVAKKLGRKAIGIDLKAEYLEMPLKKLAQERLI